MEINMWLYLSSTIRKKKDHKKIPFTSTYNRIVLAVQWSVKYIFAPNSLFKFPVIPKKWCKKEEEMQL